MLQFFFEVILCTFSHNTQHRVGFRRLNKRKMKIVTYPWFIRNNNAKVLTIQICSEMCTRQVAYGVFNKSGEKGERQKRSAETI